MPFRNRHPLGTTLASVGPRACIIWLTLSGDFRIAEVAERDRRWDLNRRNSAFRKDIPLHDCRGTDCRLSIVRRHQSRALLLGHAIKVVTLTIHWLWNCCWLHHRHWQLSLPSLLSQGAFEIVNSDNQRPFTLLCALIVLFYNSEQGWHTQHSCMHFLQPSDRLRHFLPELVHSSVLSEAHRAA